MAILSDEKIGPDCSIALKEWGVVCEALAAGTQTLLFRKGGIHEGPQGFQPEHSDFWLYPTGFHQTADGVREEFRPFARKILSSPPPAECVLIRHFCQVTGVRWCSDLTQIQELRAWHILTDEAVSTRFFYRRPGLFVLGVKVFSLKETVRIPHLAAYDGCQSWVQLQGAVSLQGLEKSGLGGTADGPGLQAWLNQ